MWLKCLTDRLHPTRYINTQLRENKKLCLQHLEPSRVRRIVSSGNGFIMAISTDYYILLTKTDRVRCGSIRC
jgi:hypothetical protein